LAGAAPHRVAQVNAYDDNMNWMAANKILCTHHSNLAKKNMPMESAQAKAGNSPDIEAVFSAAARIGKLNGYYGTLSKLALETDPKNISPIGALLKRLGVDTFGMTVGDATFRQFRINQIGDFVGEKIIQSVFRQRFGVSYGTR
jgi:hypothetical protein